jgi:hypothetical protein
LLDVLAGDLVAAGYAVCIGGEQDTDAVPRRGQRSRRAGRRRALLRCAIPVRVRA